MTRQMRREGVAPSAHPWNGRVLRYTTVARTTIKATATKYKYERADIAYVSLFIANRRLRQLSTTSFMRVLEWTFGSAVMPRIRGLNHCC